MMLSWLRELLIDPQSYVLLDQTGRAGLPAAVAGFRVDPDARRRTEMLLSRVPSVSKRREREHLLAVRLFTTKYEYTMTASARFLMAGMTCRAPYPGERHRRGRDLPDGDFSRSTWDRIVAAIVRNEAVPLFATKKPLRTAPAKATRARKVHRHE